MDTVIVALKKPAANYQYPGKYDFTKRINGRAEKFIGYIGSDEAFHAMPIQEYMDLALPISKGGKGKDLVGLKFFIFNSEISNTGQAFKTEEDIKFINKGHKYVLNGDTSMKGYVEFWDNNPYAEVDGVKKDPTKPTIFIVTHVNKKKNLMLEQTKERKMIEDLIFSKENPAGESYLQDVFVYFGVDYEGKTLSEMVQALVVGEEIPTELGYNEVHEAIIFKGSNLADFKRTFIDEANANKKLIIAINRAKMLGIIEKKGQGDAVGYYYVESFLGADDKQIMTFFQGHKNQLESLLNKIEMTDGKIRKEETEFIPPQAQITGINEKTLLVEKLTLLVKDDKVSIPAGLDINTMSYETLKYFIEHRNKPTIENKVETPVEGAVLPVEKTQAKRQRLRRELEAAIKAGSYALPEGEKTWSMSVDDLESHLLTYHNKLTSESSTE